MSEKNCHQSLYLMVVYILASGKMVLEMEKVFKIGLMVVGIQVNGLMIKQMEKENYVMEMEMSTKGIGLMIRQVDMEFINIVMELYMRGIGFRIDSMEKVKKLGLMVLIMKVDLIWEIKKAKEYSILLMDQLMRENS